VCPRLQRRRRGRGLWRRAASGFDTGPQAAFVEHAAVVRAHLSLPEDQAVVCGTAFGRVDPDASENRVVTDRAPLAGWATFRT
jgi:hypothetical protein